MATISSDKYSRGAALLGVIFLLAAAIVGLAVVTNKGITLNPNKKADTIYLTPTPNSQCNKAGLYFGCNNPPFTTADSCMSAAIDNYSGTYGYVVKNCCIQESWGWNCYVTPPTRPDGLCHSAGQSCTWSGDCCGADKGSYCSTSFKCVVPTTKPSPSSTPTPKISVFKITSGTCSQKCLSAQGSCISIGTDGNGTDGKIMSYGNWTSCTLRSGSCGSSVKNISSGGVKCSGSNPEWTNCRCAMNPYAGK